MRKRSITRITALVLATMVLLTMSVFAGLGNGNAHWKWNGGIHGWEFGGGHGFEKWFYGGAEPDYGRVAHYELLSGEVIDITVDEEDDEDFYYFEIDIDGSADDLLFKASEDVFVLDPTEPEFLDLNDIDEEEDIVIVVERNASYTEGDDDEPDMTDDVAGFIVDADIDELHVSIFDNELKAVDGMFRIDVSSDTAIWDLNDDNAALSEEDVRNTESLVYYLESTGSAPEVADAEMILILNRTPKMVRESFDRLGYKYIPLRAAASSCKYTCRWISYENGILMTRGDTDLLIRIGDTDYVLNGNRGEFSAPPILKNGKTFVPKEIIEILDKHGWHMD